MKLPQDYSIEDVCFFFLAIGLGDKISLLRENGVDGRLLVSLSLEDFLELGLTKLQSKRVLNSIERANEIITSSNDPKKNNNERNKYNHDDHSIELYQKRIRELEQEVAELQERLRLQLKTSSSTPASASLLPTSFSSSLSTSKENITRVPSLSMPPATAPEYISSSSLVVTGAKDYYSPPPSSSISSTYPPVVVSSTVLSPSRPSSSTSHSAPYSPPPMTSAPSLQADTSLVEPAVYVPPAFQDHSKHPQQSYNPVIVQSKPVYSSPSSQGIDQHQPYCPPPVTNQHFTTTQDSFPYQPTRHDHYQQQYPSSQGNHPQPYSSSSQHPQQYSSTQGNHPQQYSSSSQHPQQPQQYPSSGHQCSHPDKKHSLGQVATSGAMTGATLGLLAGAITGKPGKAMAAGAAVGGLTNVMKKIEKMKF